MENTTPRSFRSDPTLEWSHIFTTSKDPLADVLEHTPQLDCVQTAIRWLQTAIRVEFEFAAIEGFPENLRLERLRINS